MESGSGVASGAAGVADGVKAGRLEDRVWRESRLARVEVKGSERRGEGPVRAKWSEAPQLWHRWSRLGGGRQRVVPSVQYGRVA